MKNLKKMFYWYISHKHSYSNLGFQNPGQIANIPPHNLSLIFMWMTHTKKFFVTFPSHLLTPIYRPFFNSHCSTEVLAIRILRYFSYHRYLKSDNLQYNTLAHWVDGTNDSSTKRLMFQALFFS